MPFDFYSFLCSTRFLAVGTCALTLANKLDDRQLTDTQAHANTNSKKSCRKRQRPITSCKSLSPVETCAESENKWKGGWWGGGQGAKGTRLGSSVTVFQKVFLLLTSTDCCPRLPGHGDGPCDVPSDTAKVIKISIWPRVRVAAFVCTYQLKSLRCCVSISQLVSGYRCLARWHGILLSTICLNIRGKLFSLLGEHMPVTKVAVA